MCIDTRPLLRNRVTAILGALAIAACGDGGEGDRSVPVLSPTPTRSPTTIPSPVAWAVGLQLVSRSEDGGRTWEPVFDAGSAGAYGVDFVDRQRGWVVGERIFRTTNGGGENGSIWEDQTPNVEDLFLRDVAFLDTERGVVVGGNIGSPLTVLTTTDGGERWTPATLQGVPPRGAFGLPLTSVCLTTTGIGLAVAPGNGPISSVVLLSDEERRTWTNIRVRVPEGDYRGAACRGPSDLWLVGDESRVAASFDGGTSWVDRSIINNRASLFLVSAFFLDSQTGWVPAYDTATQEVLLFSTTDAGFQWQERLFATNVRILDWLPPLAVVFLDQRHGVFVGTDPPSFDPRDQWRPLSFVTVDAGASWIPSAVPGEVSGFWDVDVTQ